MFTYAEAVSAHAAKKIREERREVFDREREG
jgi:hypothetical protein